MSTAAVAWLEQDYDRPGRFAKPDLLIDTPPGLYQIKPDHWCEVIVGMACPSMVCPMDGGAA